MAGKQPPCWNQRRAFQPTRQYNRYHLHVSATGEETVSGFIVLFDATFFRRPIFFIA